MFCTLFNYLPLDRPYKVTPGPDISAMKSKLNDEFDLLYELKDELDRLNDWFCVYIS